MSQDLPIRKSCRRYNDPGDTHELTFSCYKRQSFLRSETAKTLLADSICVARRKHEFDILAWVFMPEHVHMLILPLQEDYSISAILKSIKYPDWMENGQLP